MSEHSRSPWADDPRVALSAERTFLAWVRTGLALMGFGFVVARFGLFMRAVVAAQQVVVPPARGQSLWIGVGLVSLGVLLNVAALARYRLYLRTLASGRLPQARPRLEAAVALALAAIGVAAICTLLAAN